MPEQVSLARLKKVRRLYNSPPILSGSTVIFLLSLIRELATPPECECFGFHSNGCVLRRSEFEEYQQAIRKILEEA